MKGMFKRALAGVAAAALAVTGLALGAGAANAVDGDVVIADPATVTLTGSKAQLDGRTFSYVKLADYKHFSSETDADVLGLITVADDDEAAETSVRDAIDAVAATHGYDAAEDGDPMVWAAGLDGNADSNYGGTLRQFVDDLAAEQNIQDSLTAFDEGDAVLGGSDEAATLTLTFDEPGLYLLVDTTEAKDGVSSSVPILVGTEVTGKEETIPDYASGTVAVKNAVETVTKTVDGDHKVPAVGDERSYTITSKVPNWNGKVLDEAVFTITDTPSAGQTVDLKTIVVRVDGAELVRGADYTVKVGEDVVAVDAENQEYRAGEGFSFVIDLTAYMKSHAVNGENSTIGKPLVVTYSTVLNQDAIDNMVDNTVVVNNDGVEASDTTDPEELPMPANFTFTKVKADNKTPLPGVGFQVKDGETVLKFTKDVSGNYLLAEDQNAAADGKTVFDTVTTSDPNGTVTIKGLGDGVYTVVETDPAEGYLTSFLPSFTVTVSTSEEGKAEVVVSETTGQDMNDLVTISEDEKTATVMNVESITELPLTGAAGTMLFTVLGLLIAGAGALVYMKSRSVKHMLRG